MIPPMTIDDDICKESTIALENEVPRYSEMLPTQRCS